MENFVWADVCRGDDEPEETLADGGAAPLYAVIPGPADPVKMSLVLVCYSADFSK